MENHSASNMTPETVASYLYLRRRKLLHKNQKFVFTEEQLYYRPRNTTYGQWSSWNLSTMKPRCPVLAVFVTEWLILSDNKHFSLSFPVAISPVCWWRQRSNDYGQSVTTDGCWAAVTLTYTRLLASAGHDTRSEVETRVTVTFRLVLLTAFSSPLCENRQQTLGAEYHASFRGMFGDSVHFSTHHVRQSSGLFGCRSRWHGSSSVVPPSQPHISADGTL